MKKSIIFFLTIGSIVLLLCSTMPSIFYNIWIIDILSSFKLQFIVLAMLFLITNICTKKSIFISGILILSIIWNATFMYDLYFPNRFGEIVKRKGITIASVNLLSTNQDYKKVVDFIHKKKPDILVFLEYTSTWDSVLSSITKKYNFTKKVIRNDNFGIAYFSKIESTTSVLSLNEVQIPSIQANLEIQGNELTIVATHPLPPLGQQKFESRNTQLKSIVRKRKEFLKNLIVVGDFNISSYSKHFRQLLSDSDLRDSRNGFGMLPTWPSNMKMLQTTIDHILVSKNIHVMRRSNGTNLGSDHFPIYMEFNVKN